MLRGEGEWHGVCMGMGVPMTGVIDHGYNGAVLAREGDGCSVLGR